MIIAKKKIIVYRECTSDVPIRRCRFQSANTLECQSYFGSSPYPLFVYFALRVKKQYQILGT
jgi:hypothetical protein